MWTIWDKQTEINGVSAERFLGRHPFLQSEETIFIQTVDGRVTYVEGKSIIADNYGIDPTLPDEEFIARYEWVLTHPDEIYGDDESATYDELAQVYREGVNSIE